MECLNRPNLFARDPKLAPPAECCCNLIGRRRPFPDQWETAPVSWCAHSSCASFLSLSFPPLSSNLLFIALVFFTLPPNISQIQTFQIFSDMINTALSTSHMICKTISFDREKSHLLKKRGQRYYWESSMAHIPPTSLHVPPLYPPPRPCPRPQISHISWISDVSFTKRFHRYQLYK